MGAAIILWNTVYLEQAVNTVPARDIKFDERLLKYVALIHGNYIIVTGDYSWKQSRSCRQGWIQAATAISQGF